MQGLAGVTPDEHLSNLNRLGINIGTARAIGGLADVSWPLATNTTLNLRAAGQVAFNPLPGSMGFVLGSDTGRGIAGQPCERRQRLANDRRTGGEHLGRQQPKPVPDSLLAWGASEPRPTEPFFATTLTGGLIGRYRNGSWVVELGWIDTFKTDDTPGIWNDWILGNGVYTNLRYCFDQKFACTNTTNRSRGAIPLQQRPTPCIAGSQHSSPRPS